MEADDADDAQNLLRTMMRKRAEDAAKAEGEDVEDGNT